MMEVRIEKKIKNNDRFLLPNLSGKNIFVFSCFKFVLHHINNFDGICRLHVAPFNSTGPYSTDEHGDLSIFRFHISS